MNDEIVRRLLSNKKSNILFESNSDSKKYKDLLEAPEDEEDVDDEDAESEEDLDPGMPDEEDSDFQDSEIDNPLLKKHNPKFTPPSDDEEVDSEEADSNPQPKPKPEAENSNNPLDNPYAVGYTMGDSVVLSYNDGTNSEMEGTIEGYDKEGFYRVKWNNGLLTNGMTDAAIASLIDHQDENKCICGSDHIVAEGKSLVCDKCGRVIKESIDLPDADKTRKKKIRSEVHPMSTSIPECDNPKRSIRDSIRDAFKKKVNEDWDDEEGEDEDVFARLRSNLDREFWTRLPELVSDIEDLGYDVYEANAEYVVVAAEDDEGEEQQLYIPIGGTSRTMTLDFDRARRD